MKTTNYRTFAEFYDAAMGDRSDIISDLRELISEYAPGAQAVLELAVGTGTVLAGLAADYTVNGIDTSTKMLEIARRKLPGVNLVQADMSTFELGTQFDVIFCVFDSINHLYKFEQWRGMFERTVAHLSPDGLFIFDMNTLGRFKRLEQLRKIEQVFGDQSLEANIRRISSNTLGFEYTFYGGAGSKRTILGREQVTETSFPIDQVRHVAEEFFEPLEIFDQSGNLPSDELDRTFFVYRRRHS